MNGQMIVAFLLLLLAAVMGIRHTLRAKCLGKCEGCPHAQACAEQAARAESKENS